MTKQITKQKLKHTARREILWSAWEDWTGLWEAVDQVKALSSELSSDESIDIARGVLEDLLSENLVFLCYFDDDGSQNEVRMKPSEATQVLRREDSWQIADGFIRQIRFAATDEGEVAARNQMAAKERS
jgi:hypothetical protein